MTLFFFHLQLILVFVMKKVPSQLVVLVTNDFLVFTCNSLYLNIAPNLSAFVLCNVTRL